MCEETVEARLRNLISDLEGQVRSCLNSCESPQEKLLLLEFMRLPGAQITLPSDSSNPIEFVGQGDTSSIDLAKSGARAQKATHKAVTAAALTWLEWWAHSKVFDNEATSQCCRLIPRFRVEDGESKVEYSVDFALFWPLANGPGYHKIAIECSTEDEHLNPEKKRDKHAFLHRQGWILVPLPESDIFDNPSRIVQKVREVATEENVRSMRERRCGH